MSEDNKYDIQDLVVAAVDQKPSNFEAAFNNIIIDRIRDAVENKKLEVAQQLYGYQVEPENDDEFGAGDLELDNSEEETDGEIA